MSKEARERDGKCVICGDTETLEAHHTFYRKELEDTQLGDLETLCRRCHRETHGRDGNWRFLKAIGRARKRLRRSDRENKMLPTHEDWLGIVRFVENDSEEREVVNFLREVSGMRVILASGKMWESWLSKSMEVKGRIWGWAEKRFEALRKELDVRKAF